MKNWIFHVISALLRDLVFTAVILLSKTYEVQCISKFEQMIYALCKEYFDLTQFKYVISKWRYENVALQGKFYTHWKEFMTYVIFVNSYAIDLYALMYKYDLPGVYDVFLNSMNTHSHMLSLWIHIVSYVSFVKQKNPPCIESALCPKPHLLYSLNIKIWTSSLICISEKLRNRK